LTIPFCVIAGQINAELDQGRVAFLIDTPAAGTQRLGQSGEFRAQRRG